MKFLSFKVLFIIYLATCTFSTIVPDGQNTLKGEIVDATTNEPLIGASVLVKGTTTGTVSDFRWRVSSLRLMHTVPFHHYHFLYRF